MRFESAGLLERDVNSRHSLNSNPLLISRSVFRFLAGPFRCISLFLAVSEVLDIVQYDKSAVDTDYCSFEIPSSIIDFL